MIIDCICFKGDINWDAWTAIGQIGGAIATFWAVVIALRARKSKILIRNYISYQTGVDLTDGLTKSFKMLNIEAINQGSLNLNITKCVLELGSAGRVAFPDGNNGIGQLLTPEEPVTRSIRAMFVTDHFNRISITGKRRIRVIFSDNHGNEYTKYFVFRIGMLDEVNVIQN